MYFEIVNPVSGLDSIVKVTLSQTQNSIDFSDQNFSSTLFAVPRTFHPIGTEDLEIKLQYFKNE